MKINLFVNLYVDNNEERQRELNLCLQKNIDNPLIDSITIIATASDAVVLRLLFNSEKIKWFVLHYRPTFGDYFKLMNNYHGEYNVLSNADIYFDDTLSLLPNLLLNPNVCFALTKWEYTNGELKLYNNGSPDSQDTWIFRGWIKPAESAEFTLGVAGCDNKIALLLQNAGYEVKNPSKSIRTIHVHDTQIRNYVGADGAPIERIPPPYLLIDPTIV